MFCKVLLGFWRSLDRLYLVVAASMAEGSDPKGALVSRGLIWVVLQIRVPVLVPKVLRHPYKKDPTN